MKVDISSLEKVIAQLKEALFYCASDLAKKDDRLALHLRAAAIQAFKFTYELSIKMLKRYLELAEASPGEIDKLSFNELMRMGYGQGLVLSELVVWKEYRRERGTTGHTYDEDKAEEVFQNIPGFLKDAEYLLHQIKIGKSKAMIKKPDVTTSSETDKALVA